MAKEPSTRQFWTFVSQHRYIRLLLPILGLIGGADVWLWYQSGDWPWLLVVAAIAAFVAVIVAWNKIRSVALLDPDECKDFFPFLNGLPEPKRLPFYLPRPDLLGRLKSRIASLRNSHLMIVGESGSGKTTVLDHFKAEMEDVSIVTELASEADTISILKAITSDRGFLQDVELQNQLREAAKEPFDARHAATCASKLAQRLSQHITKPTYVLIDQAERFKPYLDRSTKKTRAMTLLFLESLKNQEKIHVIFSIRSDKIDGLITLLGENGYDLFFLKGFDVYENTAAREIMSSKFQAVGLSEEHISDVLDELSKSGNVNAFDFQMAGYVYECFGVSNVNRMRGEVHRTDNVFFDIFHDALYDEFGFISADHLAAADLEVVLFIIAYYNKRKSLALRRDDAILLSHIPESNFTRVEEYLKARHLLDIDDLAHSSFRLAHDLVVEQVLSKEPRHLQPDQQIALEKIIDELPDRMPSQKVLDYVTPFIGFARRKNNGIADFGNPETVLLWLFALLYFLRIAYPESFATYIQPVNSTLDNWLPGIVFPASESNYFFAPIALTQYIWVMVVYGLNRGFFFYIWEYESNGVMSIILRIIGPFGAFLGLLLSYAPGLFIIPIGIPGLILGVSYVLIATRANLPTAIYRYLNVLGWATIGNMVIAAGVTYLLIDVMRNFSPARAMELGLVNLLTCALFCYFAYQMRWRQGTNLGRSRMLAMYHAGRKLR